MIAVHTAALASSNVAYHEFLLCYKATKRVVYAFVEGREDPCFYRGVIENMLPDGWEVTFIKSGSKKMVLNAFDCMNWKTFSMRRICFFIDRDLSSFLGGETHRAKNIYVTDNYSIECDVVCPQTLERVLEEVCGITLLTPAEKDVVVRLFETGLKAFREAMAPVMAQIILWRRAKASVTLNNIEPKVFFDLTGGITLLRPAFSTKDDRIDHAAAAVNAARDISSNIDKVETEFRNMNGPQKFTRGKYLLWFFIQFINELHRAIPKYCARHPLPPKSRVSLGTGNAMVVIAPRTRCPASLRVFVTQTHLAHIKRVDFFRSRLGGVWMLINRMASVLRLRMPMLT